MPVSMTASLSTGPKVTIEDTTVNSVNNTSGGAILQFNGSPTPSDYAEIGRIISTNLHAGQAPSGPPSSEQLSYALLAQLLAALGSVTIRNSTLNGTNNTSGGLIVLINNNSRGTQATAVSEQDRLSGLYTTAEETSKNHPRQTPTDLHSGQPPPRYRPPHDMR